MTTAFTFTPSGVTLENMRVTIGGTAMGGTKGGVTFVPKVSRVKQTIDQYGDTPVKSWNSGDNCTVKLGLAETTYANMAKVMRSASLRSSGGSAVGLGGLFAGNKVSSSDSVALLFHPLILDDTDLTRDVNCWRAICIDVQEIKYGPDGATVFMTEWELEHDSSKTAGDSLIKWGLAAAT